MKWEKVGKIFNPSEHKLANNCMEYAQSPQALVLKNYVRIYFSTRELDDSGKYLSHISYVDMDKSMSNILGVAKKEVLPLGKLGCYDEHGIFPLNVLKDGEKIWGYIGGWNRRISVSIDGSIGLAESKDGGETFERIGDGPILTASPTEPFLIADPFVMKIGQIYHMWYIFGARWIHDEPNQKKERIYKIGHAVSSDNINWLKDELEIIPNRIGEDECQALPTVIKIGDTYHMYFCYRYATDFRDNIDRAYRLGYAQSTDLIHWTRNDASAGINISETGWDSKMQCYPNIFEVDGEIYMLYNGNEFGRQGFGLAKLKKNT